MRRHPDPSSAAAPTPPKQALRLRRPGAPLRRRVDWPDRLHAFVRERQHRRFEWGAQDCALFACDAALAITGVDLAADFRGGYADAEQARESLAAVAGDLEHTAETLAAAHGIAECPPAFAQRGDIALVTSDDETDSGFADALMVVMAGYLIGPAAGRGLARQPLSRARRTWAVGRDI